MIDPTNPEQWERTLRIVNRVLGLDNNKCYWNALKVYDYVLHYNHVNLNYTQGYALHPMGSWVGNLPKVFPHGWLSTDRGHVLECTPVWHSYPCAYIPVVTIDKPLTLRRKDPQQHVYEMFADQFDSQIIDLIRAGFDVSETMV